MTLLQHQFTKFRVDEMTSWQDVDVKLQKNLFAIKKFNKMTIWQKTKNFKKLGPSIDILGNIDWLMACPTCLVCLISTVSHCCKKAKNALDDVALVVGT